MSQESSGGIDADRKQQQQFSGDSSLGDEQHEIICNDEGASVAFGSYGYKHFLYCGRKQWEEILRSYGQCDPLSGPQCASCKRLQKDPKKRLDILRLVFPALCDKQFVSSLRMKGGVMSETIQHLIKLGAPYVELKIALPGYQPDGLPERPCYVPKEVTVQLREVMDHVDDATAEAALRRNNLHVGLATASILDTSEADMLAAVREDKQMAATFSEAFREFLKNRQRLIQEKCQESIPDPVLELSKKCFIVTNEEKGERLKLAAMDGHYMQYRGKGQEENNDEAEGICSVCAHNIPNQFSGSYQCKMCRLCEGCIQFKVLFRCTGIGNGGHLHHHPLVLVESHEQQNCNVHGRGCTVGRSVRLISYWFCEACNFAVCTGCIANDTPSGFHRRLGRVGLCDDDDDDDLFGSSSNEESVNLNVTDAAQRAAPEDNGSNGDNDAETEGDELFRGQNAQQNEPVHNNLDEDIDDRSDRDDGSTGQDALNTRQNAPGETNNPPDDGGLEGEDEMQGLNALDTRQNDADDDNLDGDDATNNQNSRDARQNSPDPHADLPNFDEVAAERVAAARWEGAQRDVSIGEVIVGTGEVGTTTPDINTEQQEEGRSRKRLRVPQTEAMLSVESARALETFTSVGRGNDDETNVAAASDVHHVENLLHRAHHVGDESTINALQEAVAAGKVEIAGTLLLAHAYAPSQNKRKREGESTEGDVLVCFCGETIDEESAPDGAVGCINGHGMHPGCAADQLLGGGHCPTCRSPLFFPKVPSREAKIAMEFAKAELQRAKVEEEERIRLEADERAEQGLEIILNMDDLVRISSDSGFCSKELMKRPDKAGWSNDMAGACGLMGRITEIIRSDKADGELVAARVRTKDLGHSFASKENIRCRQCYHSPTREVLYCAYCLKCQTCCQKVASHSCPASYHEWYWTPSVLALVCRSRAAVLWDKSLVDKDVAAASAAEQHIVHLRAELKAVKAARVAIKEEMEKAQVCNVRPATISREFSTRSRAAVEVAVEMISHADWQRARHLLLLARQWDSSEKAKAKRELLYSAVRKGEIDSVARIVRRYNACRVADASRWADAASEKCEYMVEKFAKVDLFAWPSASAPKTGYSLGSMSRFMSRAEWMDRSGNVWLQVDEGSFVDFTAFNGKVVADLTDRKLTCAMLNARVCTDSDESEVGVITAIPESGIVTVRWNSNSIRRDYRAGKDGKHDLVFASLPPLPPQGWLCMRPGGLGSPAVVRRARSSLRCFCCGDGLIPKTQSSKQKFSTVKKDDKVLKGEILLVAATLEPVAVVSRKDCKIVCSFVKQEGHRDSRQRMLGDPTFEISYRPEDLVYPLSKESVGSHEVDELVLVDGHLWTRRELVLKFGDEAKARSVWEERRGTNDTETSVSCFASCARGHLLHARCFQGALLAGQTCPAPGCSEPLWVPKVKKQIHDDDACCGGNSRNSTEEETRDVGELLGNSAHIRTRDDVSATNGHEITIEGVEELKMCPVCCSGPLFNENCNDMEAHHGQCVAEALGVEGCNFVVSASDIVKCLSKMSGNKTVAEVLPQCPRHNVLVMFNGCMNCGNLFTDTPWKEMPKWDPTAKAALELDVKKREAARLLADEIRKEAAMLQFERDALWNSDCKNEMRQLPLQEDLPIPPVPLPAEDFDDGRTNNGNGVGIFDDSDGDY